MLKLAPCLLIKPTDLFTVLKNSCVIEYAQKQHKTYLHVVIKITYLWQECISSSFERFSKISSFSFLYKFIQLLKK